MTLIEGLCVWLLLSSIFNCTCLKNASTYHKTRVESQFFSPYFLLEAFDCHKTNGHSIMLRIFQNRKTIKVPILQVVISFRMKLWPVAHFFSLTFGIGEHTKHYSMSFLYSSTRNDMLQCFVCSPIPKVSEKNGQPVRVSLGKKLILAELVL